MGFFSCHYVFLTFLSAFCRKDQRRFCRVRKALRRFKRSSFPVWKPPHLQTTTQVSFICIRWRTYHLTCLVTGGIQLWSQTWVSWSAIALSWRIWGLLHLWVSLLVKSIVLPTLLFAAHPTLCCFEWITESLGGAHGGGRTKSGTVMPVSWVRVVAPISRDLGTLG